MKIFVNDPTLGLPVPDIGSFSERLLVSKTDSLHLGESNTIRKGLTNEVDSFSSLLARGLDTVSQIQLDSDHLARLALSNPESVEVHEVTVAMAKASMSLGIAKSVIDRTIASFREILNQR